MAIQPLSSPIRHSAFSSLPLLNLLPPLPDGGGQQFQHVLRILPAYTRVGDGDAVFQARFARGWDFLIS